MTELQSAKYLTEAYFEEAYASLGLPSHDESTSTDMVAAGLTPAPQWTTFLSCIVFLCGFLGGVGVVGGSTAFLGFGADNAEILRQAYAQSPAHARMMQSMIDAQLDNKPVILFNIGLQLLVGFGFIATCILLFLRHPSAYSLAVTVFTFAIFYNVTNIVVTWLVMPSEIPGVSSSAATVAKQVALGSVALAVLVKSCVYAWVMSYLSRPNIKALFAPPQMVVEPSGTPSSP